MQVSGGASNRSAWTGNVVDALVIGRQAVAHATHLGDHPLHLVIRQNGRSLKDIE